MIGSCQIDIPETEYYQKVSSHAQIRKQKAEIEKLRELDVVLVGIGIRAKTITVFSFKMELWENLSIN